MFWRHAGVASWVMVIPILLAVVERGSAQMTMAQVFERGNPSVVTVSTPDGFGSGFIISEDGTVVTNYHVIRGERQAAVVVTTAAGRRQYAVTAVETYNSVQDFAVLKINATGLPVVPLGDSDALQIGERVVAIGNPLGLDHTLSEGVVSQKRDLGPYQTMLQISVPIDHGSSGGPLFNMKGEVVGITSSGIEGGPQLNFAVPINYVRVALDVWTGTTKTLGEIADWQKISDQVALAAKYPSYRDADGIFTLRYPSSWQTQRCQWIPGANSDFLLVKETDFFPPSAKEHACHGNISEGVEVDVVSHRSDVPLAIDRWINFVIDGYAHQPGYVTTDGPHAFNFAGLSGRAWTDQHAVGSETEENMHFVAWHSPDFAIHLQTSTPESREAENKEAFNTVVSTFKLIAAGQ
jgi:Trypsin-like peptidase domain